MKKILTLLGLGLSIASGAVQANTGSINFHGQINAGTCPIEIIDPQTGLPMNRVFLGNVPISQFEAVGSEAAVRMFSMRITPTATCDTTGKTASVVFSGAYGAAGTGGTLYALQPGSVSSLALAIKDDTNALVNNGSKSKDYTLDDSDPTDMLFSAMYKAVAIPVTAGPATTDINFVVTLN